MKITKKKRIYKALWVMECPKCGYYAATASEKNYLPDFTYCDCDCDYEKMKVKFKRFLENNKVYGAFERNLKEMSGLSFDEYLNKGVGKMGLINQAFNGEDSPEKDVFWWKIDILWGEELFVHDID